MIPNSEKNAKIKFKYVTPPRLRNGTVRLRAGKSTSNELSAAFDVSWGRIGHHWNKRGKL
jgi:hypothetical protein